MGQTTGEMRGADPLDAGYTMSDATTGDDADTQETEEIRAQIEQTRSDMSETIDAIQERLNPDNLKEQAQEMVREATVGRAQDMVSNVSDTAKGFGSNMLETIKENPLPSALAAISIAWLINKNASKPNKANYDNYGYDRYGYDRYGYRRQPYYPDYTGYDSPYGSGYGNARGDERGGIGDKVGQAKDKVGDTAGAVGDKVGEAAGAVGDRVGRVAQTTGDKVGEFGGQAQYKAEQAGDWFQRMLRENPLAVGVVGVAVGAAIGMLLPETQQEHQMMGPARDNLMYKAQEAVQSTVDKVQRVAGEAQNAAQRAAEDEGLSTQSGQTSDSYQTGVQQGV